MVNRPYADSTDVDEMDATTDMQYQSMTNRVAAVFDNRDDAERAIDWLRSRGVSNDHISVMAKDTRQTSDFAQRTGTESVAEDAGSDAARGAATGLAAGAGVGALFGLAAAMIPGIGPFITAGALANALGAAGGGAVAGAIVGGTSGAIAGALSKWGLDQADADYYGREIDRGGTFVAVDLYDSALSRSEVEDTFRRFNGRWASA
jgi:hypothetical protein